MNGSTGVEWNHATEQLVIELDNNSAYQLQAMRLCRMHNTSEAEIHIEQWVGEEVFLEDNGLPETARVLFMEAVDWAEVTRHFQGKSIEVYLASTDDEAGELVDLAIKMCWGDGYWVEAYYFDRRWYACVQDTWEVYKVVDVQAATTPTGSLFLDFALVEDEDTRQLILGEAFGGCDDDGSASRVRTYTNPIGRG